MIRGIQQEKGVDNRVYGIQPQITSIQIEEKARLQQVNIRNDLYKVKKCIEKYYFNVSNRNKEGIYNILDDEYISFKGITLDNIESYVEIIEHPIIDISRMYESQTGNGINIYYVSGNIINYVAKTTSQFSLIVKTDEKNNTFKIILEDYIKQKYGELKIGDKIQSESKSSIPNVIYNTYKYEPITEEKYITDIFKLYVNNLVYNTQGAYTKLDEEYREERFPTIEDFEEYVQDTKSRFVVAELKDYKKYDYKYYIQYKCITTKGDYFIINETNPIDYEIILEE